MPFYLIWKRGDTLLRGYEESAWVDGSLVFPITFPGRTSAAVPITLQSSARDTRTFETLQNIRLYLTGTDVSLVQETWPYYGDTCTPSRPELNGGFEVSFDHGRSWTRFSKTVGYEPDPSTWVSIPTTAVGLSGLTGQLGPFDQAHLLVRYTVPQQTTVFKVLDIQLAADFDVV